MQIFSSEVFSDMAAARRASAELPFIAATLRERGDPLASRLPDAVLEREIRATLAVCDRLGLGSDIDRLGLCMLEITRFAGLRDLPKLQGLLNYAGAPGDHAAQGMDATGRAGRRRARGARSRVSAATPCVPAMTPAVIAASLFQSGALAGATGGRPRSSSAALARARPGLRFPHAGPSTTG